MRPLIQCPSCNISLMYTLIAKITIARIPKPMPFIMKSIFIKWSVWSRSQECIPVDTIRNLAIFYMTDTAPRFKTKPFGHVYFAKPVIFYKLHCLNRCGHCFWIGFRFEQHDYIFSPLRPFFYLQEPYGKQVFPHRHPFRPDTPKLSAVHASDLG